VSAQIKRINDLLPETLRGDYRAFQYMDTAGKWHLAMGRDLNGIKDETIRESLVFGGIHMTLSDRVTVVKSRTVADKRTYCYGEFLALGAQCLEDYELSGRNSAGFNEPMFTARGPEVILGVRPLHDDFFAKCPSFQGQDNKHYPFLIFEVESGTVEVKVVHNPRMLLPYPSSTQVMVQWPGKWSSDYFCFKVGDLAEYMVEHELTDAELGTPGFGQQYQIPERVLR
jgi:hypothetical protein